MKVNLPSHKTIGVKIVTRNGKPVSSQTTAIHTDAIASAPQALTRPLTDEELASSNIDGGTF